MRHLSGFRYGRYAFFTTSPRGCSGARDPPDAGYWNPEAEDRARALGTEAWVSTERQRDGGGEERSDSEAEPADAETDPLKRMRSRLASEEGRALYARRKAVVEPVNGQIKQARGFRQFSFRGLEAVGAEWALVCLCHNLLKMFRNRPEETPAAPPRSAPGARKRGRSVRTTARRAAFLPFATHRYPHPELAHANIHRNRPGSANPGPPTPVNPARQLQPSPRLRPGKRLRRTDS